MTGCPECGADCAADADSCQDCGAALNKGARALIGNIILGSYQIVQVVGQGGMSVVYKARHRVTDQIVALKILPAELAVHTALAIPLGWLFGYVLASVFMASVDPEQFRAAAVVSAETYAFASLVVIGSSLSTALVIRRRLDAIDLVGALKARD